MFISVVPENKGSLSREEMTQFHSHPRIGSWLNCLTMRHFIDSSPLETPDSRLQSISKSPRGPRSPPATFHQSTRRGARISPIINSPASADSSRRSMPFEKPARRPSNRVVFFFFRRTQYARQRRRPGALRA